MPRLSPSLFWRARRDISPLAARLLPACRELDSAANELRWIREHVRDTPSPAPPALRVWELVERRAQGVPLQYVLGSQPFGDLDIKCRPGVLIPRPETEAYTLYLASLLSREAQSSTPPSLSVLDLCTGTGCIPLLLLSALSRSLPPATRMHLHGVDISPAAVALARSNQAHNRLPPASRPHHRIAFSQNDIFSPLSVSQIMQSDSPPDRLDVLVSNPPYISPAAFSRSTARSVRNHEPRLALVPPPPLPPSKDNDGDNSNNTATTTATTTTTTATPATTTTIPSTSPAAHLYARCGAHPEDIFYARILEIVAQVRPRRAVLEVGGLEQALRVVRMAAAATATATAGVDYQVVEIWRDEPAAAASHATNAGLRPGGDGASAERMQVAGREVRIRGVGEGRAVYLFRG